ncbi:antibiotic biosynthesis monooxygenase [Pontiellaceae bacterium B12219]|nr:antibiotic biosynthesis monooxygenase [Pontiellaceae bacterium B12219]
MKSEVVTLSIDLHFTAENAPQAIQLLISGCGKTEAKPGCQQCQVTKDTVKGNRVRYTEAWNTQADFDRHLQSEEFRRVLVALDMCCEEPKVAVGNFSGHTGLPYLQQMCNRCDADRSGASRP